MPAGAVSVKATYANVIETANCTITVPIGGATPDFNPVSSDSGKYTVKLDYWYLKESPYPHLGSTDVFAAGKKYALRVIFTANEGYSFGDKTVFKINGEATFPYGIVGYREIEFTAPVGYDITVTGGKATVGAGTEITKAAEGTTVTLTANAAPAGQVFDKWEVVSGSITLADANSETTTFTMPAGAVSVKATYKDAPHTHSYGSEWKSDADKHWHECSCGDKSEEAAHTAGDWITDTAATATTDGTKHKECTVCGYVMETATIPATGIEHTHNYSSDWKSDADKHWHECSCGDKSEEAAHTAGDWITDTAATATTDGTKHKECTVCGYVMETATIPATGIEHTHNYGSDWKADADEHWHECSCGAKANKAAHADENNDGKCDICDYAMGNAENPGENIEPEETGLSGGAIAGIAVGSVAGAAALGCGGFAIFWFVIKKKKFADLIALFKKK